jgi:hypothetical protein
MLKIKNFHKLLISATMIHSVSYAGMTDQLGYNVLGQITNAIGARLSDAIYYGQDKKRSTRRSNRKGKSSTPKMTPEKKIQKALTSLGFYGGKIDGEMNSFETRSSIKKLNVAYGIGKSASLKAETKDTLIYLGTLFNLDRYLASSNSDKRSKGKKLQASLKVHGFYVSKIDGAVGSGTRRAIAEYKISKGFSGGSALGFEDEYQLISSAKKKNDSSIEETIAFLENSKTQGATNVVNVKNTNTPIMQAPKQTTQNEVAPQMKSVAQKSEIEARQMVIAGHKIGSNVQNKVNKIDFSMPAE